jgi:hypothetical protein
MARRDLVTSPLWWGAVCAGVLTAAPAWAQADAALAADGDDALDAGAGGADDEAFEDPDEGGDRFERRGDKTASLIERAATLIDRTSLGGFGEHDFVSGQGETARFRSHRYVLTMASDLTDRISTTAALVLRLGGSPRKEGGVLGIGDVSIGFAVADVVLLPSLAFRSGVVLMPFGAVNLHDDGVSFDLTARPLVYGTVVPSLWREVGVGFFGRWPLASGGRVTYEVYVVNGVDARIVDGAGLQAAAGALGEDNNHDKAWVGRLAWSPRPDVEMGFSAYTGNYDADGHRLSMGNMDVQWRLGGVELLGEVVVAQLDSGFVQGFPAGSPANLRTAVPEAMWGFYAQVAYHFAIEALRSRLPEDLRGTTFAAALRYDGADTDTARLSVAGDARRLTLGFNVRPADAFVFKADLSLESRGVDAEQGAREAWEGDFWRRGTRRCTASVAFLF